MTSRTAATLITATIAATIALGGALPASAAPGDWEEYDRVGGMTTPNGIAVHEASGRLFVTEPGGGSIAVLNADTLALVERVGFAGMEPLQVAVDQDSGVVYFVDADAWQIVRWDPSVTPSVTTTFPLGYPIFALELVPVSTDPTLSSVLWTAYDDSDGGNGTIHAARLDLSDHAAVSLGPGVQAFGLTALVDPDPFFQVSFYTNYNDGLLVSGILPDIAVGNHPVDVEVALSDDNTGFFAVANNGDNTVSLIEGSDLAHRTISVAGGPFDLELAGFEGPMFVVSESGLVSVVAAPFTEVGWTIPLGAPSWFGQYSSTLNRFFASIPDTGEVVSIALTPGSNGGDGDGGDGDGGGLAATGTDSTAPALFIAFGLALLGALAVRRGQRQRGAPVEK